MKLYHRKRKRWLVGVEKMQLMAMMHGSYNLNGLTSTQVGNLAGNAVHNVCSVAIWLALLGSLRRAAQFTLHFACEV